MDHDYRRDISVPTSEWSGIVPKLHPQYPRIDTENAGNIFKLFRRRKSLKQNASANIAPRQKRWNTCPGDFVSRSSKKEELKAPRRSPNIVTKNKHNRSIRQFHGLRWNKVSPGCTRWKFSGSVSSDRALTSIPFPSHLRFLRKKEEKKSTCLRDVYRRSVDRADNGSFYLDVRQH